MKLGGVQSGCRQTSIQPQSGLLILVGLEVPGAEAGLVETEAAMTEKCSMEMSAGQL